MDVSKLLNKNTLRKALSDLSVEQISKLSGDIESILVERSEQEEAEARSQEERLAKIAELQKMMEAAGLSLDDIKENVVKSGKAKKVIKPKYRLIDDKGSAHEWSGRGRMPKVFAEFVARGGSISDKLIEG